MVHDSVRWFGDMTLNVSPVLPPETLTNLTTGGVRVPDFATYNMKRGTQSGSYSTFYTFDERIRYNTCQEAHHENAETE